ncbi:hypothetical protein XENORESO_012722 [Xenotaenia resolanae]|uniref:Transmembrane protein n=1 Tax=Xenotaenia resolanae TaxID=208358 RepID=A0ABV0WMS4_9TELE
MKMFFGGEMWDWPLCSFWSGGFLLSRFRCCSGLLRDFLDELPTSSCCNFGRPVTPGIGHLNVSPFMENDSECGSLEYPKALEMVWKLFFILIDVGVFVSYLFVNFLRCGPVVSF